MSRPTLQHLQLAELIAHAGGDPWAVDDSLQAGSPTQIDFLAQAFHQAAGSATAAEETFRTARQHFEQYHRESGEQPINHGAEVQRVKDGLHASTEQLGRIAADLETIAGALAQARAASQANITALNANLVGLDNLVGHYLDLENEGHDCSTEINQCRQQAKDDTATALHNGTVIRNTYSKALQQALTNLRVRDGYDPDAAVSRFDADAPSPPPGPVPDDPKAFNDYWNSLTPGQKDWLYNSDHNIGNHPGMPCDPPDHLGYDHYNRLHLADELTRARAAATQADALQNEHPDWAAGNNIPRPNEPGAIFADRVAYENWQRRYDAARDGAKYLPDLQAVDAALQVSPDRRLMLLDTESGTQARAAIAVGDPDKATHVSVTAPGLNTTVHGAIGGMTDEATHVRGEALRQLGLSPGHEHDSVSAIAWIGYDPPQVPGFDDRGASLAGIWGVTHDDLARAGAHDLARFYDGIQASHLGGPADLTAIGHSYGSLTTGLALQEPGDHGVSRALFYGSPGIEAATPEQLHLRPGQVFAMEAPDDPIQWVYDARTFGQGIPILGSYLNDEFGDFGPNPATNPNFTQLATGAATVPDGHGGTVSLQEAHGHSDYPRFPDGGGLRTTNYNIAAVLAGTKPIEGK
ncbi:MULTISPECIES: alpha/beta hydrolase [Mycobacteriaceae]|uniref:Alpha/beta hydrolase n=2 Tax=Mycolicibacter algericus TaxID=1288388 RepID=A0A7I9YFN2_MYCAL|nr:alpha/beta hydrolase [Mycolicibacter algericus]OQZ98425.1 hypothetical protein BST10_06460 [Mycolicibacter algericus DSM 45454]GFG87444.1 hypothetical protein MALGJ_41200 [Mycolicibacter algericus]